MYTSALLNLFRFSPQLSKSRERPFKPSTSTLQLSTWYDYACHRLYQYLMTHDSPCPQAKSEAAKRLAKQGFRERSPPVLSGRPTNHVHKVFPPPYPNQGAFSIGALSPLKPSGHPHTDKAALSPLRPPPPHTNTQGLLEPRTPERTLQPAQPQLTPKDVSVMMAFRSEEFGSGSSDEEDDDEDDYPEPDDVSTFDSDDDQQSEGFYKCSFRPPMMAQQSSHSLLSDNFRLVNSQEIRPGQVSTVVPAFAQGSQSIKQLHVPPQRLEKRQSSGIGGSIAPTSRQGSGARIISPASRSLSMQFDAASPSGTSPYGSTNMDSPFSLKSTAPPENTMPKTPQQEYSGLSIQDKKLVNDAANEKDLTAALGMLDQLHVSAQMKSNLKLRLVVKSQREQIRKLTVLNESLTQERATMNQTFAGVRGELHMTERLNTTTNGSFTCPRSTYL